MGTPLLLCSLAFALVQGAPKRSLLDAAPPTTVALPDPLATGPPAPSDPTVGGADPLIAPLAAPTTAATPAAAVPPPAPTTTAGAPTAPANLTPPAVAPIAAVPPALPPPSVPALQPPPAAPIDIPPPRGSRTQAGEVPLPAPGVQGSVTAEKNTTGTGQALGVDAEQVDAQIIEPAQPSEQNLTAPDGFKYDFRLESVDYILPNTPLAFNNFSTPPAAPPNLVAAVRLPLSDGLVTWDFSILQHNKALAKRKANRKIEDAVVTLKEAADIAMEQPLYLVTNKTNVLSQGGQPDPQLYYSLSDFYIPDAKSAINPDGVPYKYSPSVNTATYKLAPNKVHMELTIDEVMILALAAFFHDNAKYAKRSRDKVYAWFLDPQRGMKPTLRGAAVHAGVTKYGRPEGIADLAQLSDLLNAVGLLQRINLGWTPQDSTLFTQWISAYATFLETDPLAKYARVMANYVGTSFDEQLLACYMYLGNKEKAAQVINYTWQRKKDQIVDGVLRYERDRQRSLEFTQTCIVSWVRMAIMVSKLGVGGEFDLWTNGLGAGNSVKDAVDRMRPSLESKGDIWPFKQVGARRVRILGELLPRVYVGYRLTGDGKVSTYDAVTRSETAPPPPPPIVVAPPAAAPAATPAAASPPPSSRVAAPAAPGTLSPGATVAAPAATAPAVVAPAIPPPAAPVGPGAPAAGVVPPAATPTAPAVAGPTTTVTTPPVAPAVAAPTAAATTPPTTTTAPATPQPPAPAAPTGGATAPLGPVGRRLQQASQVSVMNSGPVEYIQLYNAMWPTFNTSGSQARAIIKRLPSIELDSEFALEGIPLINECDQLSCDTRTIVIWSITGILVTIVAMCLCWNCFIHWRADHATDVPHYLRNIRKQQAKYKEMNIKIAPAKPEYMLDMKAKEAADKAKTERTFLEVKAQKELRKEITQLESRIQRKRESKMQSQMQSQYAGSVYGSAVPTSYYSPSVPYGPSHAGSVGASSVYENSFMQPSVYGAGSSVAGPGAAPMYNAVDPAQQHLPRAAPSNIPHEIPEDAAASDFSFPASEQRDASHMSGVSPNAAGGANTPISGPLSFDGSTPGAGSGMTGLLAGAKEFLGEIDQTDTIADPGASRSIVHPAKGSFLSPNRSPKRSAK